MPRTLLFDRSERARFTIDGAAAAPTLNGLVTNDVAALRPGDGCYAALLTAKGKLVGDVRILALDGGTFWMDTGERAAAGVREMLTKYVNPRFARVSDVSGDTGAVLLWGPDATALVARVTGIDVAALGGLAPHAHGAGEHQGAQLRVMRVAPLVEGQGDAYELVGDRAAIGALCDDLVAGGAEHGDDALWDALRIARGAPEWGVEMDDTTLAPEANLDERHAVSYTKGCYIGQETVARVHFRGHANRSLRRVRIDGALPSAGAPLLGEGGAPVGEVRSAALAPWGDLVGIAMVRREVDDGAELQARWDGGDATVEVLEKAKGAID